MIRVHILSVLLCFLFLLLAGRFPVHAQEDAFLRNETVENEAEEAASKWEEEGGTEELADKLLELRKHPVSLNQAGKEDLERLFMLNEFQILALLDYRATYGNFASVYELQNIPGFSPELARQISEFVVIEPDKWNVPDVREALKSGRHDWYFRMQRTLEPAEGYSGDKPEYAGSPVKTYHRYAYRYQSSFSAGYTLEKDAGEPFPYKPGKSLFDFQSAYIRTNQKGTLKKFVAGDYQLAFGQGLVMWNGYAPGKSSGVIYIRRREEGITQFSSTEENRFFRGAAGTLEFNNLQASFFFSGKAVDANITRYDGYSGQVLEFSSLITTGYHATASEIHDRKSLGQTVYGTNLSYNTRNLRIGTTWVQYRFEGFWRPYPEPYKLYAFRGKENTVGGIDYQFRIGQAFFFGEIAASESRAVALNTGVLMKPAPQVLASVAVRNYPADFQNLFARPMGESYYGNNEQGIYYGMEFSLSRHITIKGYIDWFRFPWLKYEVDAPSGGLEEMLQITWAPGDYFQAYARFSNEMKQVNGPSDAAGMISLVPRTNRNFRFQAALSPSQNIVLRTRLQAGWYRKGYVSFSASSLIAQDFLWNPAHRKFRLAVRYSLFDVPGYDSRIYVYENDLQYVYSVPSFYGKGTRVYLNIFLRLSKRIDLGFKIAQTSYLNRSETGSGASRIAGNRKTDAGFQVHFSL